ncbi:kinase-like protein [Delitschia confertaspora ATCC 74209]|uniref:Kinase-like protein n=1 Tax=Delitschia confertaspora ATCC 74209 TaxID=1513339 RepID=A0A9P4JTU1_9PLEO|nr:kinase-like protein [Delitschia confertaspora ATCC 74209]
MDPPQMETIFIPVKEGDDLEISSRNVLPFRHIRVLGQGGCASVEEVQDIHTGAVFAHKIFRRFYGRDIASYKKQFHNEIAIIRRLSEHLHIIRVFATYTCGREAGMILTPVANGGDLATFLQEISDSGQPLTNEQSCTLNQAFGCLASGLKFIHEQTIRHKDIKPQNILLHNGLAIYTDFGVAVDASLKDGTTTAGRPDAFTRRYCAPEVADWDKRNRKSDIFSLGCVYIEILAVLTPEDYAHLVPMECYYDNINQSIKAYGLPCTEFGPICADMLEPLAKDRPSSNELVATLRALRHGVDGTPSAYFCHECALDEINSSAMQLCGSGYGESPIELLMFSPDGKSLASADSKHTISIWGSEGFVNQNTASPTKSTNLSLFTPIQAITFCPLTNTLAIAVKDDVFNRSLLFYDHDMREVPQISALNTSYPGFVPPIRTATFAQGFAFAFAEGFGNKSYWLRICEDSTLLHIPLEDDMRGCYVGEAYSNPISCH